MAGGKTGVCGGVMVRVVVVVERGSGESGGGVGVGGAGVGCAGVGEDGSGDGGTALLPTEHPVAQRTRRVTEDERYDPVDRVSVCIKP